MLCANTWKDGPSQFSRDLPPKKRGIDVIALRQEPVPIELVVEAKGETSERKGSQRYGNPFDSAQVKIHIYCQRS